MNQAFLETEGTQAQAGVLGTLGLTASTRRRRLFDGCVLAIFLRCIKEVLPGAKKKERLSVRELKPHFQRT